MNRRFMRFAMLGIGLLTFSPFAVVAPAGTMQCDRECDYPSVSDDGKIIAMRSCSSNWSGNLNVRGKVFVYNRERHKVLYICKNGPYNANDDCTNPQVSGDGRQVVYETGADNLIGGITNNVYFVTNGAWNILACEIEEGDFSAPAPGFTHRLINMAASGAQANRVSYYPVCSSNGRFVAFQTKADNLDPDAVDTNYDEENWIYTGWDIYLRDRDLDGNGVFDESGAGKTKTTMVSHDSDLGIWHCCWYPSISADGKYVAYELVSAVPVQGERLAVCVYNVAEGTVKVYRTHNTGEQARISPDGGYLVAQYNSTIYNDYRTIMFALPDTNWWYAAVPMNVSTGVCVGTPEVSAGGHYVAFYSGNTHFVNGDTNHQYDVFVRVATGDPRNAEYYELVSKSTAGEPGNGNSGDCGLGEHTLDITPNGRFVVYVSEATNLVAVDTNALQDVFIRDRWSNTTDIVAAKTGSPVFPAGAALTVPQITDTSAFFQWPAATDVFPIWEYQLTLESGNGTTQLTVNGGSTSCSATGLTPGTDYTATLYAYDGGGNHSAALTATFETTGQQTTPGAPCPGDYDGDRRADPATVALASWYFWLSGSGYGRLGPYFSVPESAAPLGGDFDGDRKCDMAIAAAGQWTVWASGGGYAALGPFAFALAGGTPVTGDFDGDGRSDPAMVAAGQWTIWASGGGYAPLGPFAFALAGGTPVTGDFDGDGRSDPAMVADEQWTVWASGGGYAPLGPITFHAFD